MKVLLCKDFKHTSHSQYQISNAKMEMLSYYGASAEVALVCFAAASSEQAAPLVGFGTRDRQRVYSGFITRVNFKAEKPFFF